MLQLQILLFGIFFFFNSGTETPWSLLKEDPVTCKTELVSSDRCRSTLKSQPKVP